MNKIIDKDLGMAEIVRGLKDIKGKAVKIGLQGSLGNRTHEEAPTLTVVDIGTKNEFGDGKVPERSFLRAAYDEYVDIWLEKNKLLMSNITLNRLTMDTALQIMGLQILSDIKNRILKGISPENAPMTKKLKEAKRPTGSTLPIVPLIDTSQMFNSLTSKLINSTDKED